LFKETERILKFGHHRVSTFGIGNELDRLEWKSVFRQLLSAGYLKAELSSYGGLRLSDKSRPVLRKKQKMLFRKDPFPKVKPRVRAIKRVENETVKVMETEGDKELFEKLRSLRTTIAQKYGLPPYVIFHDRTLHELVSYLPQSLDEMHGIHGIGETKRENYGQQFLEVILEHVKTDGTKDGVGSDSKITKEFQSHDDGQAKGSRKNSFTF